MKAVATLRKQLNNEKVRDTVQSVSNEILVI